MIYVFCTDIENSFLTCLEGPEDLNLKISDFEFEFYRKTGKEPGRASNEFINWLKTKGFTQVKYMEYNLDN